MKKLLIVFIAIMVTFTGCSLNSAQQKTNEIPNNQVNNINNEIDPNNQTDVENSLKSEGNIPAKEKEEEQTLDVRINNLLENNGKLVEDISIWRDSEDNKIAIVTPKGILSKEVDLYHIPEPTNGFFLAYTSKIILDFLPEIDKVFIDSQDDLQADFMYVSRETYQKNGLKDLSPNKVEFYATNKKLNDLVDYYGYDEIDVSFNLTPIASFLENIYKERFLSHEIKVSGYEIFNSQSKINRIPDDDIGGNKLKSELAKAFVSSLGRYENHYYRIYGTSLLYKENDKELFKVFMYLENYKEWKENGLNPNDLYNYSNVQLYAPNMKTLFEKNDTVEFNYQHNVIEELDYETTLEKLKEIDNKNIDLFTNDNNDRVVVLKLNNTNDNPNEIYKREMSLTHQIMKLPIDTIWFITVDNQKYQFSEIDRDRYNLLLYMNPQDKFDFNPDEWPIMVGRYWEMDKMDQY